MDANDLRIGNLIKKDGIVVTVDGRTIFDFWCYDNVRRNHEPITLTENWLISFGFKPFSKDWSKNGVIIHTRKRGYVIRKSIPIIESVHQLQNLYFALRGEELTPTK